MAAFPCISQSYFPIGIKRKTAIDGFIPGHPKLVGVRISLRLSARQPCDVIKISQSTIPNSCPTFIVYTLTNLLILITHNSPLSLFAQAFIVPSFRPCGFGDANYGTINDRCSQCSSLYGGISI